MRIICFFLFLSACASPAPQFFGAVRHDITLEGHQFVVYHKGDQAEIIRMGYVKREHRGSLLMLMQRAAEETTGCIVVAPVRGPALPGDTGEIRLRLRCPDGNI